MKNINTYSVRITEAYGVFDNTLKLYREAVSFFVDVIKKEWCNLSGCKFNESVNLLEPLTVENKNNPFPKYNFTKKFYKFPCYYRRAAIMDAYGIVSSYKSNLANWNKEPVGKRGKEPTIPKQFDTFPCLYRGNCFIRIGENTAKIKAFVRNTWDWVEVKLRKTDVKYITRRCSNRKECVPKLIKKGKVWELAFTFEHVSNFIDKPLEEKIIVSVDMGLINAATCVAMTSDGTVVGREFLSLPSEYDSLRHSLNSIRKSQKHGSRRMPNKWSKMRNINIDISRKTAKFIVDFAFKYNADVVVMESLQTRKKKRGGQKQRLHHWRCQYVQEIVNHQCHNFSIRTSHVCAAYTSRYAFDGSGEVKRGKESERTKGNYSLCEFTTGKVYNCDLNASYNIGARYFIRETLREIPEMERLEAEAKVPGLSKRSTCVLSDLQDLYAVLHKSILGDAEYVVSGWSGIPMSLKDNHQHNEVVAVGSTPL